jgi:N-acetylmuramoyl-L-alanine amidase
MAKFPRAKWVPLQNYTADGQDEVLGLIVHIMEGTLEGSRAWFNNPSSQASAHFGNAKDGRIEQWVDTKDRAWAQAGGNRTYLSIENEGKVPDALTDAQVENVAQLFAWVHKVYGVPLQKANAPGERGLGWHGMGGAAWGGHTGCPGDHIRAQFDRIVARAEVIAGQPPTPTPIYAPFPGDKYFFFGRTSNLVTEVGKALVRAGYKGYKVGPGPVFGPADRRGVQWFQTQHSELAGDADGHFGPLTWKMLKVAQPK